MKAAEAMTRDVDIANPEDSLQDVTRKMAERDIGFVPVGENDELAGTIADRDIVVRAPAAGKGGDSSVRDAMTKEVKHCFDGEEMRLVVPNTGNIQVRRLPVVNRAKRLVGVLSLADAALADNPDDVGVAFTGVVGPRGLHSQTG